MKYTRTSITVRDIEISARHGVLNQERIVGNDFLVTVELEFDATCAMDYDDLKNTVDYAMVVQLVKDVMAVPSLLIEHVTRRIISALTEEFPMVTGGTVTVTKKHPPVATPTAGASFTASFVRS